MELADAYDVILGEDWLSKDAATMSYKHKCCVIDKGSQRYNLVPDGGSAESAPSGSTSFAPVTAIQANRALTHGCTGFLVVCTAAQTSPATCAAANPDLAAQPAESHLMPEFELKSLLHEYSYVFPEGLPAGLPPERNMHHIPCLLRLVKNLPLDIHIV